MNAMAQLPSLSFLVVGALCCAGACRARELRRPDVADLPGMLPGEHMLYQPSGDPEALLGREVIRDAEGRIVIADERRPGCEVAVRREPAAWHRGYHEDLGRAASLAVGTEQIGELLVRYEKGVRIRAEIENREVLHADVRGECGTEIVTSVMVGTGARELEHRVARGGGVSAPAGGGSVGAVGEAWDRIGGTLSWTEPQAWAFRIGTVDGAEDVDLVVHMPARVAAGDVFSATIEVQRSVWLVVLYEGMDGDVGVLVPSPTIPGRRIEAGGRVELPPFEAVAAPGRDATRETLVVYGFVDAEDYEALRPPAGDLSGAQAKAYADDLVARLEAIPRRRWIATTFSYVIEGRTRSSAGKR